MPPRYDLLHILSLLRSRIKFILLIAALAAVGAGVASLLGTRKYEAVTEFFVSSPFLSDRNNIYHTSNQTAAFIGYFASDEDIDKLIGISHTEEAKTKIVRSSLLATYGKPDTANSKVWKKLVNNFYASFDIKRSEYGLMQITFLHKDPKVAANVANTATAVLGDMFTNYHLGIREDVAGSLQEKVRQTDSGIAVLTDTLASLRDRYQIYDILSPTRQTIITGNMRNGGAGFGYAVEQIQNIESIKDQMVMDRARYQSILNEYAEPGKAAGMLRVISAANVPSSPAGPGTVLTAILAFFAAAFFAALWVLVAGYLRSTQERSVQVRGAA